MPPRARAGGVCSHGVVQPDPPFFVFDGGCGFCRKWAAWAQRRVPPSTTFVAYQDLDDLSSLGLTAEDVETASYWIDTSGRPHRGSQSFAHALRQARFPWTVAGAVLRAPVVRRIAERVYVAVARNRHRLPAPGPP